MGCDVSESLLVDTSKKLVDSGLRDVGYNYVVLDDCWSEGRAADGYLREDLTKFPSGMKQVAAQIHEQGLLFGMYSSSGEMTCARFGMGLWNIGEHDIDGSQLVRSIGRHKMRRALLGGILTT